VDVSPTLISNVTDAVIDEAKAWQPGRLGRTFFVKPNINRSAALWIGRIQHYALTLSGGC